MDIFRDFPALPTVLWKLNFGFFIFRVPLLKSWAGRKTLSQMALCLHIPNESIVMFINRQIGEAAGCFSADEKNISSLPPGFYKSTPREMEKIEEWLKKNDPRKMVYLDVSDLPAPEPLMRIREALMKNPPPELVKARHRKYPLHLPGYLEGKPYHVYAYEKSEEEVYIFVFHKELPAKAGKES